MPSPCAGWLEGASGVYGQRCGTAAKVHAAPIDCHRRQLRVLGCNLQYGAAQQSTPAVCLLASDLPLSDMGDAAGWWPACCCSSSSFIMWLPTTMSSCWWAARDIPCHALAHAMALLSKWLVASAAQPDSNARLAGCSTTFACSCYVPAADHPTQPLAHLHSTHYALLPQRFLVLQGAPWVLPAGMSCRRCIAVPSPLSSCRPLVCLFLLQIMMGALKLFLGPQAGKAKRARRMAPTPAGPEKVTSVADDRKKL